MKTTSEKEKQQDIEATMFAMAILMPEKFIRQALSEIKERDSEKVVKILAKKFEVSEIMMASRLTTLKIMI